ncbi:MAG: DUF2959 domain-containing protein [Planctomycetota bacterium]|nr:DUF2959 domain-containing protein [Planctomycetota bacterium]
MSPHRRIATALAVLAPALASLGLGSCQSAYFATMEQFGYAKREILVDRVEDAKDEQKEAKEQFVSTYERFKSVTGIQGGKLEDTYKKLNGSYEDCDDQAEAVRSKIQSVEDVADAMFSEWKTEIGQYSDPALKRASQDTFDKTKSRYADLIGSMKKASASMDPVLSAFKDRVLFLKHNLNAQAINSLSETVVSIEGDVTKLIDNMQASITEADEFLGAMKSNG